MKLTHNANPEGIIVWGDFPPASEWDAQIAWRDKVARAIGDVLVCAACGEEPPCDCSPANAVGERPPKPPTTVRLGHPSNGFQYGVDISAGNVECGYLKPIGDKFLIVQADTETGELPKGAKAATYCFYASWR